MPRRADLPRPFPWRIAAFYFVILSLAGVALGVLEELAGWSDGIAFVVTVVVGTPIAFAAVHDTINWLRSPHEGRRTSRHPSR